MKKYLLVLVVAILVVVGALYWSGSGPWRPAKSPPEARAVDQPSSSMPGMPGMPAEKPSGQEQAAPAPAAQAPSEQPSEAPMVEITNEKQQLIGVKTVAASVQQFTRTIRTTGLVEYDQRRLNTINTKIEGWVEKLYVNFTGTYVKKGDIVADIYSPELWATQQEFINVVRWAKQSQARTAQAPRAGAPGIDVTGMINKDAQALVEAARQRLKLWDISDAQIAKIEQSEQPIRTLAVYSPYAGYVLQKNVNQGMKIMAGEKLFDIADLSTVWITADIYEFELPLIKVGDTATVQLAYFPGNPITAKIDYIYPTLTGETRTARARFSIPNPGGQLKPQMFTNVEVKINLGRKLAVPSDAVINTGVRQIVYIDRGNGMFEPKEVATGVETDTLTEITAGLKAGDKVASAANFLIDSEAKLKGVEALPRKQPAPAKAQPAAAQKPGPQAPAQPAAQEPAAQAPAQPQPATPPPAHRHGG